MATLNDSAYTAASLLIVSELIREKPDLRFSLYSLEQITRGGASSKNKKVQDPESDSEEERFVDADKVGQEEETKQENNNQTSKKEAYDPLKRDPKWSHADSVPLFELVHLTTHTHPTVKLWAEKLLRGELLDYAGDPLLDFGLANFLDRIAYKNPKSLEKVAKYASGRRMAASEQPINTYDFSGEGGDNDMPKDQREEEQYLYKYFKMRGPKAKKATAEEVEEEGDEEDPEMEKFANDIIEKEMKKMNKQNGDLSDEDDDVLSQLSGPEENDDDDEELEADEDDDFFDQEEGLEDVAVDDNQEDSED
jgi:ribosome biogenesis protein MAK21